MEDKKTVAVKALKAHLALNVKSVERSLDFYRRMLGIEPAKVRTGYAKFDVENPPLNLTLNEVSFGERGALSHLGIQLSSTDDVLATRERWKAAGLSTLDEMQTNCCYAIQDKTWVADPDGNQWEAFVVLKDNLAETTACCGTGQTEKTEEVEAETASAQSASCSTEQATTAGATSCCAPAASSPVSIAR